MKRLIPVFLSLIFLFGCTPKPYEAQLYAMDTTIALRLYGENARETAAAVSQEISKLEGELSVTRQDSQVYALNQGQTVTPSPHLQELLTRTLAISQRTGGALDPTICPIVTLWGFTTGSYHIPTQEEIDAALSKTGQAHILRKDGTLSLSGGCMLDFGAVAKGYCGDLCRRIVEKSGGAAFLALGGNIQTVGEKPDGTPWSIGITNPRAVEQISASLTVTGTKSIVTSGDYQRYFEQDGKRYCHIMDPKTGACADTDLISVTIVADSGLLADGLSTALFVMGTEQALAFWRESQDFEAVLIQKDGAILVTEGLQDSFFCAGNYQVIAR